MAAMNLREREKRSHANWEATGGELEALWKEAFHLYCHAFDTPKDPALAKRLAKLKRNKPIPPELHKELFDYENFLLNLGRLNLNVEAHGGLYTLHSHLNHSCAPNVSVRHLEGPNQPGRITVLAKLPIRAGEELLVSYIDPSEPVNTRRRLLREWNFGECRCPRCVEEAAKPEPPAATDEVEGDSTARPGEEQLAGLEDEIRDVLGL